VRGSALPTRLKDHGPYDRTSAAVDGQNPEQALLRSRPVFAASDGPEPPPACQCRQIPRGTRHPERPGRLAPRNRPMTPSARISRIRAGGFRNQAAPVFRAALAPGVRGCRTNAARWAAGMKGGRYNRGRFRPGYRNPAIWRSARAAPSVIDGFPATPMPARRISVPA